MRGTSKGVEAFEKEIRLTRKLAGTEAAIARLSVGSDAGLIGSERYVRLLSDIAVENTSTENAERAIALVYLDDPSVFEPAMLHGAFREALAKSMVELGLPKLALPLIEEGVDASDDTVLEVVEALLDQKAHREALAALGTLEASPKKTELFRRAMHLAGHTSDDLLSGAETENGTSTADNMRVARNAAASRGDYAGALIHALNLLETTGDPSDAEQTAMLALQAGETELPQKALDVLSREDPLRLSGLELLFREREPDSFQTNQVTIQNYLSTIDEEISLIEGMLNDG